MENLKIYNKCKEKVLTGMQLQKKHTNYSVGKTLFATSDIGNFRENQEDSVIILTHPNNYDFKLIAVADGVGGSLDGELASNHVIKKLIHWFESIDKDLYHNISNAKESLNNLLSTVLIDLDSHRLAATTLSVAIIGEANTLIANVGDSRIYTYKDKSLKQITKDDTITQEIYDEFDIYPEEIKRFHKYNHGLSMAITKYPTEYTLKYNIINNDYESIYAMSDGVTDTISKEDMETIIKTSKTEEITSNMIKRALTNTSFLNTVINNLPDNQRKTVNEIMDLIEDEFDKSITAGKDNATIAAYIKK